MISSIEEKFNSTSKVRNKCSSLKEYELRNLIYVAKSIVEASLKRKESIGAHYRADATQNNNIDSLRDIEDKVVQNEPKIIA